MLEYVTEFKLFSAGLIWVLALVGGFGPLLLQRQRHHQSSNDKKCQALITSVLNMFAGGIFLSGACLHLLPDAQENEALAKWLCSSEEGCFKWANFFFGCGFLLVLLMEVFAHALQHKLDSAHHHHKESEVQERTPLMASSSVTMRDNDLQHQLSISQHHHRHESCSSEETDASIANSPQALRLYSNKDDDLQGDDRDLGHTHHDHDLETGNSDRRHEEPTPKTLYGSTSISTTNVHDDKHDQSIVSTPNIDKQFVDLEVTHTHVHGIMDAKPILAFVAFLALSFHSVMEGMGIGASDHAAWDILIAVLAHKSLAAFALMQELLHHKVPRRRVLSSVGVFSIMTPAGILFGWLLVDTTTESMGSGICSALAGGTFLFVAVMEVIPQELKNQEDLIPKCSALLAGFGIMGVLSIWA